MVKLKLGDILESGDTILLDGSIRNGHNICWDIYDSKKYSDLEPWKLKIAISSTRELSGILFHERAYTIEDVTREIRKFEKIISDKIKFLVPDPRTRNSKPSKKTIGYKIGKRGSLGKELLSELQKRIYNIRRRAEQKEITRFPDFNGINDRVYENLLTMTKLLSSELGLKIDEGYIKGQREKRRENDSDTDEKLVATLYRMSMSGKNCCLVSQDEDFLRLLGPITRIIGSDYFFPFNQVFRTQIKDSPFILYYRDPKTGIYDGRIDSIKTRFDQKFRLGGVKRTRVKEIKEQIYDSWKDVQKYLFQSEYNKLTESEYIPAKINAKTKTTTKHQEKHQSS